MKFFIDTANLAQIKEAQDLGVLDGVTTNPSLMAKEGISGNDNIMKHYVDICNIVDGDVSAEVISTDYQGIIAEGEKNSRIVTFTSLNFLSPNAHCLILICVPSAVLTL